MTEPSLGDRARLWAMWAQWMTSSVELLKNASPARVAEVFPEMSPMMARAVAVSSEAHRRISRTMRRSLTRWGSAWLLRSIEVRGKEVLERLASERRPTVVLTWHAGASQLVPPALASLGRRGVVFQFKEGNPEVAPGFERIVSGFDRQQRAKSLATALRTLKQGDLVVVVLGVQKFLNDGPTVPFLGRAVQIPPGPAVLRRLTGAALVPAVGRLSPLRAEVELFEPLETGTTEQDTARAIAAFFEPHLAAHPGSIWRTELDRLVLHPRL